MSALVMASSEGHERPVRGRAVLRVGGPTSQRMPPCGLLAPVVRLSWAKM